MRRALPFLLLSSVFALAACDKKAEDKKDDKKEEAKKESDKDKDKDKGKDDKADKKDAGITFKAKAPAVGDKTDEKKVSDLKMTMSIEMGPKPKTMELAENETSTKKTEVLAVDGKAVTKAKITYADYKKVETEDGKEKKKPPSPLAGKTYVLELKDGKTVATDEKGGKLPKDEETKVLQKNRHFGKPDPVLDGLPTESLKPGDKADKMAKALEQYFADDDDSAKDPPAVTDVTVKLDSIEKDGDDQVGVFSVKLTLSSKDNKGPVSMKMPLEGKVKVRAKDGFTTSIDLKGPLSVSSNDAKMKISAKGDAHMTLTNTR